MACREIYKKTNNKGKQESVSASIQNFINRKIYKNGKTVEVNLFSKHTIVSTTKGIEEKCFFDLCKNDLVLMPLGFEENFYYRINVKHVWIHSRKDYLCINCIGTNNLHLSIDFK